MRNRPQLYPTRYLRRTVDAALRALDKTSLFQSESGREEQMSDVPLSVFLPIHPKDLWIASHAVDYLRRNLLHPISEVLIVSGPSEEVQDWCRREDLSWLDEGKVCPWDPARIAELLPEGAENRKSWLFQQLLKLSANEVCQEEFILVLDADTLLLKKKCFVRDGLVSIDYSHERNLLYLKSYRHLLGEPANSWFSFVTHYMLMEKRVLGALKKQISETTGMPWDEAIVSLAKAPIWTERELATQPFNFFSEYETYGNFARKYRGQVKSKYFRNYSPQNFDRHVVDVPDLVESLPSFYTWASFHSYNDCGE